MISLNVEPGVKRPDVARLRSGAGGVQGAFVASIFEKSFSTWFGLKPGEVAITRMRPVLGSRATAEPHLPASACSARYWAPGRTVSWRSLPLMVEPDSLSTSVLRPAFAAVR